jgi:cell wall-associated NlpC family hydrolase
MYNPEQIQRDYVSYLDQAALDPFNTVYESGNLIAPPSFVDFTFSLLFDRQIEEANGKVPRGVLADYDFFDIVVRNAQPGEANPTVPDNGILMVNPQDITVVFSRELTVQGRPINARVNFMKFSRSMVPTRMMISLTIRISYFGPLRAAFGLDTNQNIPKYEALIPYDKIYNLSLTEADLTAAQQLYEQERASLEEESKAAPRRTPSIRNALATGTGVVAMGATGASGIAGKTLEAAVSIVGSGSSGGPPYTYGGWTRTGPPNTWKLDCSGLIYAAYHLAGASQILGVDSNSRGSTASLYQRARVANSPLKIICDPTTTSVEQLKTLVQKGDLVLNSGGAGGRSEHVGFFNRWEEGGGDGWYITHQGGTTGTVKQSIGYLQRFNHILRPMGEGNAAGFPATNQSVSV